MASSAGDRRLCRGARAAGASAVVGRSAGRRGAPVAGRSPESGSVQDSPTTDGLVRRGPGRGLRAVAAGLDSDQGSPPTGGSAGRSRQVAPEGRYFGRGGTASPPTADCSGFGGGVAGRGGVTPCAGGASNLCGGPGFPRPGDISGLGAVTARDATPPSPLGDRSGRGGVADQEGTLSPLAGDCAGRGGVARPEGRRSPLVGACSGRGGLAGRGGREPCGPPWEAVGCPARRRRRLGGDCPLGDSSVAVPGGGGVAGRGGMEARRASALTHPPVSSYPGYRPGPESAGPLTCTEETTSATHPSRAPIPVPTDRHPGHDPPGQGRSSLRARHSTG